VAEELHLHLPGGKIPQDARFITRARQKLASAVESTVRDVAFVLDQFQRFVRVAASL
jgi:hypothetical protein